MTPSLRTQSARREAAKSWSLFSPICKDYGFKISGPPRIVRGHGPRDQRTRERGHTRRRTPFRSAPGAASGGVHRLRDPMPSLSLPGAVAAGAGGRRPDVSEVGKEDDRQEIITFRIVRDHDGNVDV